MQLTPEEVSRLATLSRLDLAPEEAAAFGKQLSAILGYVSAMSAVGTDDIAPLEHVAPVANVFRKDETHVCPPETREALIAAFPEHEDSLLKVKAVFS